MRPHRQRIQPPPPPANPQQTQRKILDETKQELTSDINETKNEITSNKQPPTWNITPWQPNKIVDFRHSKTHTLDNGITWTHAENLYTKTDGGYPGLIHQQNLNGKNGPEYHHNPDIITLGCSITHGYALPHDFSWPHIVAHLTGHTVNNIAIHGENMVHQWTVLLNHIKHHGTPQHIWILAPNLDRYTGPWHHQNKPTGPRSANTIHYDNHYGTYWDNETNQPITQTTISGDTVIPAIDNAIFNNLLATTQLLDWAETHDIHIKLNTWETHAWVAYTHHGYPLITYPQHQLDNHQKNRQQHNENPQQHHGQMPPPIYTCAHPNYCGCDLQPQNEWQHAVWERAHDTHHPGLHHHIHYTEQFLNTQITNHDIANLTPWWTTHPQLQHI